MTDFNPKVSIVIPVYNGANYLREAIDSALAQTYDNVEVIVVNDGSDDAGQTESIAKSFGERIRYFFKENGGVASALNLGIREMTGDYFAWLSHDDIYLRQKIEFQVREMQKKPYLMVSFCTTNVFYKSDAELFDKMFDTSMISTNCVHGALSYFSIWIYACSLLIHRSCFDKIGMINENLKTAQDIEITLRLLTNFDALHIELPLTLRRDHCESGYNTMRHAVSVEYDSLIESIIVEKGLEYFFPNVKSNLSIAKAYNKLGDYLIHYSVQLPQIYYEKSMEYWSSLLNPALYKSIIGVKATRFIVKCKLSAMYRLNKSIGQKTK